MAKKPTKKTTKKIVKKPAKKVVRKKATTKKSAKKPAPKKKATKKAATAKVAKRAASKKTGAKKPANQKPAKKKSAKAKATPKRKPANNKTHKTAGSVESYLASLEGDRQADCRRLAQLMRQATGDDGAMWGPTIVGFGHSHLIYETGREMDWFLVGFSSRKQALTLYLMGDFESRASLMAELGPHKTGKSCLYIKRLDEIHEPTLRELIAESVRSMRAASKA